MECLFLMFLDHTQRRSTIGRTPLEEWSARRRDLYLTTHDTHNRQISMPMVGFEPTISVGERPQTYASDRTATGTGITGVTVLRNVRVFCFLIPWVQILVGAIGTFHIVWSCRKIRLLPYICSWIFHNRFYKRFVTKLIELNYKLYDYCCWLGVRNVT